MVLGVSVLLLGASPRGARGGPACGAPSVLYPVGEGAADVAIGDINADRRDDVLVVNATSRAVGVYMQTPSGALGIPSALPASSSSPNYSLRTGADPRSLAIGDIDNDGDIDAATCSAVYDKSTPTGVAWFENDGKGRFRTHRIAPGQAAYDLRLVDMDGDGDVDILVAGQQSRNVVWFENRLKQ